MELGRELRFGIRDLTRARGYTVTAVLTLSCAMAVNAAMLGAAHAVLRPPDAIQSPDDLVVAWSSAPERSQPLVEVTYQQFLAWTKSRTISQAAAFGSSHWPMVFDSGPEPLRLTATAVSASFFDTLGTRPPLGRGFTFADDTLASGWVAVLSHRIWRDRFSGDPTVVGTTVRLDGKSFTIVGVAPEGFDFPRATDLWTPVVPLLAEVSERNRIDAFERVGVLYVVGRLIGGVPPEAVGQDFQRLTVADATGASSRRRPVVTPLPEYLLGPVRTGLWWLLAAVIVLLVVACANLSALALTRVLARRRDDAVRLALGAPGSTLARRWFLECLVVTTVSVLAGLAGSRWLMTAIVMLAPDDIPRMTQVRLNLPVAALTIMIGAVAMILWGTAPILAARSRRMIEALHDNSRATSGRGVRRFRSSLVVAQICLSVALLIVAGLIVRSFVNLRQLDLGFNPDRVLALHVEPSGPGSRTGEWFQELSDRLEKMPDIEAAGAVFLRPLIYGPIGADERVVLRGQPDTFEAALKNPPVSYQTATPGYFRAMRIPLLRGRAFDARDRAGAPRVVLVSASAARALWPGKDPIGQELAIPSLDRRDGATVWRTVAGVVKDVHYRGIGDVRLDVYEPAAQAERRPESIVVRTAGTPLSAVGMVYGAIREADPRAIISGITTLDAVVSRAVAPWRLTAWILGVSAAFTLLLALVGLVAQLSIELAQRRQEFAIRLAVGAAPRQIRSHVMGRAAIRMLIGASLGALTALAVTRSLDVLLFGVTRLDPLTWAAALIGTCAAVAATSFAMAHRVLAVDPAVALRAE